MNIEKKVCAFIDILGFSNLITEYNKNNESKELFEKLKIAISSGVSDLSHELNEKIIFKIFSDNIAISYNGTSTDSLKRCIHEVLNEIKYYQLAITQQGFFLRGGIAYNEFEMNNNIIYGIGMLRAYEIENKEAIYPMIAVDKNILEELSIDDDYLHTEEIKESLLIDKVTGNVFINYLSTEGICSTLNTDYYDLHKQYIEDNLIKYKKNSKILDKYLWLADYHNYCVENYYLGVCWVGEERGYFRENIEQSYNSIGDVGISFDDFVNDELNRIKQSKIINLNLYKRFTKKEFEEFTGDYVV